MTQEFEAVYARYLRELAAWQAARVRTAARLLGMSEREVTVMDIVWCHTLHGVPPLQSEAPTIGRDRRFRLPKPPAPRPRAADSDGAARATN